MIQNQIPGGLTVPRVAAFNPNIFANKQGTLLLSDVMNTGDDTSALFADLFKSVFETRQDSGTYPSSMLSYTSIPSLLDKAEPVILSTISTQFTWVQEMLPVVYTDKRRWQVNTIRYLETTMPYVPNLGHSTTLQREVSSREVHGHRFGKSIKVEHDTLMTVEGQRYLQEDFLRLGGLVIDTITYAALQSVFAESRGDEYAMMVSASSVRDFLEFNDAYRDEFAYGYRSATGLDNLTGIYRNKLFQANSVDPDLLIGPDGFDGFFNTRSTLQYQYDKAGDAGPLTLRTQPRVHQIAGIELRITPSMENMFKQRLFDLTASQVRLGSYHHFGADPGIAVDLNTPVGNIYDTDEDQFVLMRMRTILQHGLSDFFEVQGGDLFFTNPMLNVIKFLNALQKGLVPNAARAAASVEDALAAVAANAAALYPGVAAAPPVAAIPALAAAHPELTAAHVDIAAIKAMRYMEALERVHASPEQLAFASVIFHEEVDTAALIFNNGPNTVDDANNNVNRITRLATSVVMVATRLSFVGINPFDTQYMQSLYMVIKNNLGKTYISQGNFETDPNGVNQSTTFTYTQWIAGVVERPQQIARIANQIYAGYEGGKSSKIIKPADFQALRTSQNDIETVNNVGSIYIMMQPASFRPRERMLSLSLENVFRDNTPDNYFVGFKHWNEYFEFPQAPMDLRLHMNNVKFPLVLYLNGMPSHYMGIPEMKLANKSHHEYEAPKTKRVRMYGLEVFPQANIA